MFRIAGPIALLALVLVLALYLLVGDEEATGGAPSPAAVPSLHSDGGSSAALASARGRPAGDDQRVGDAPDPLPVELDPSSSFVGGQAAEQDEGFVLSGSVVLERHDGAIDRQGDGTVLLHVRFDEARRVVELPVNDGRFEATLEAELGLPVSVRASEGSFAGVLAIAASMDDQPVVIGGELILVMRVTRPLVLDVRDAESGLPLVDVDVARASGSRLHPGFAPVLLVEGESSPVDLRVSTSARTISSSGQLSLIVGARGYAWEGVDLDVAGGERLVELVPGGSLSVSITGMPERQALDLEVRAGAQRDLVLRTMTSGDRVRLVEGLKPGPVEVAIQRDNGFRMPVVFGSAQGTIRAGETTELSIQVDPSAGEVAERFEVTVVARVPAAWETDAMTLSAELVLSQVGGGADPTRRTPIGSEELAAGGRSLTFALGELTSGLWSLEFDPSGWCCDIVVDHSGVYPVELPARASVLVEVVDELTGAPVDELRVFWLAIEKTPSMRWSSGSAEDLDQPGNYRFDAPVGRVRIYASSPDRRRFGREFDLVAGEQSLRLSLPPSQGVRVRVMHGAEVATPMDPSWQPFLERDSEVVENERELAPRTGGEIRLMVDEPGTYTLVVPPLAGFAAVDPIELEIPLGEVIPFEVQVQKLP